MVESVLHMSFLIKGATFRWFEREASLLGEGRVALRTGCIQL